jgi:hypothetical protein
MRTQTKLDVCWGCRYHVHQGTALCPFCGADIAAQWAERRQKLARVEALRKKLESLLQKRR